MCCCNDQLYIKRLANRSQGKKWIKLWKVLRKNGASSVLNYQYCPGVHADKVVLYDCLSPKGFHVYLSREIARNNKHGMERVIPVYCNMNTLIAADRYQAVFGEIKILKKNWNKANFILKTKKDDWIKLFLNVSKWQLEDVRAPILKTGVNNGIFYCSLTKNPKNEFYVSIPVMGNRKYLIEASDDDLIFKQIKATQKDILNAYADGGCTISIVG